MELCFISLSILGIAIIPGIFGSFLDRAHEFPGPYCENRPRDNQCCPGRDDNCNAPIVGTYCYCDAFCNNTAHDCCPDFWGFCLGVHPPTERPLEPLKYGCLHHGIGYEPGQKVKENCNECSCSPSFHDPAKYEMRCSNHRCAIESDVIDWVNDGGFSWRSGNYSFLWGKTMDEAVKYRLGTIQSEIPVLRMSPLRVTINEVLPERFDAREEWPSYIHRVRDQGNCGASWAFSSSGVASDRLAIESGGLLTDTYSVQNLLSCHKRGQNGCEGGYLDRAWYFLRKKGVVNDQCYRYKSGKTDEVGQCRITYSRKDGMCPDGHGKYSKMFKTTPPYRIAPVEREIMKEIRTNGPVQATFQVKPDFFSYKGGIYRFSDLNAAGKKADTVGHHSVKILGWGVERSLNGDIRKYWICENSWGRQWGENGYFRVLKGSNECDIESFIIGVFGRISGDRKLMRLLTRARRKRLRTSRKQSNRKSSPK